MSDERDAAARLLDALGSDAAAVRRAGFAGLLRTGAPVHGPELAASTRLTSARVDASLRTLVGAGAATVDAADALVATGGLSVVRTAHRLSLGRRGFFTWCAFDAIGIPAALGLDAVASTACGDCGGTLRVEINTGEPVGQGRVRGWLPGGPCANIRDDFCASATLFCDAGHLRVWRAGNNGPVGRAAGLDGLAAVGRAVWAELAAATATSGDPPEGRT